MDTPTNPATEPDVAAGADQIRHAVLRARFGVLEQELEAAPFHRVGTFWWDERTKEMQSITRRLGR